MQKNHILKKNWEFKAIISNEKQIVTKYLILYYKKSFDDLKVGISISKKFANAVLRNRYRRQVRNILKDLDIFNLKYNVVIILRKPFLSFSFIEKTKTLKQIFERL